MRPSMTLMVVGIVVAFIGGAEYFTCFLRVTTPHLGSGLLAIGVITSALGGLLGTIDT